MQRLLSVFLMAAGIGLAAGGWVDLLPDAKFTGWTRLPIPPTGKLADVSQWKTDRARRLIVCEGNGGHEWLRYDRELSDFLLHVEWRFTPRTEGETKYNSGIFFRNSADGAIWHQAQTGAGNGGYIFANTLVGGAPKRISLKDTSTGGLEKPAGEWNTFEIRCEGRKVTLTVNGKVATEFSDCDVPKGYIGLEAEGYRIEFRNVRVKDLK